jgi:flap endonuclease-1
MDEFIDLCILCGCDYCGRIRNCGYELFIYIFTFFFFFFFSYKKAYDWIKKYHNIENVLKKLKETDPQGKRFQIPDNFPYQTVRGLFKSPGLKKKKKKIFFFFTFINFFFYFLRSKYGMSERKLCMGRY